MFLRNVAAVCFTRGFLLAVLVLLGDLAAQRDFVGSRGELFALLATLLVLKVRKNNDVILW